MDAVSKLLDFLGKYAWAVFVTAGFVLFMPEDAAKQLGLSELRQSAKGIWWIVLVLSLAVWLGAVFKYFDTKIFDGWLKARLERRKREEKEREFAEALALRLRSLDGSEQMWIKYCLFHNTQTLSAERTNRTAQSLYNKGIVQEGSGHLLDLVSSPEM